MWIVSKEGLVNTDNVVAIGFVNDKTAVVGNDGKTYVISDNPVVADILVALQNGEKFLEVE